MTDEEMIEECLKQARRLNRNVDCEYPCYETIRPTHFRPIPSPPKKEGE